MKSQFFFLLILLFVAAVRAWAGSSHIPSYREGELLITSTTEGAIASGTRINPHCATESDLDLLPGIGAVMASRIAQDPDYGRAHLPDYFTEGNEQECSSTGSASFLPFSPDF